MKKHYTSPYNPAVKELSDFVIGQARAGGIPPHVLAKITPVLDGIEVMDNLLVQKDSVINQKNLEVQSKDNSLIQKERQEFIEVLQRLDPSYTDHIGDWPNNIYKDAVIKGNPEGIKLISESLPTLKQMLLTKEFIIVLNKINPEIYKTDIVNLNSNQFSSAVSDWPNNIYKDAVIKGNPEGIKLITDSLPILKGQYLPKNEFIEVLHKLDPESYPEKFEDWSASRGKELIDNEDYTTINSILPIYRQELEKKLAAQKENELEKLKEALSFKETEIQNKDQLLLAKELEKQELLAQKNEEVREKSLVKNQVISELQEDVGLKEKEALNLKIELLTKQLESANVINELKDKLLVFQNLSKQDETLKLELSVIKHRVEENSGNMDEIKELSRQLDGLIKQPAEKEGSVELLKLLDLSAILPAIENPEHNPIAVVNNGNFELSNVHTTHSSVILAGEFSNVEADNFN